MKTFKCPSCDADLSFSDDREFGFCEYCGTKILLGDYSVNHITKHIVDEAQLRNAEIREKELRFAERKYNNERRRIRFKHFFRIGLFIIIALLFIVGYTLSKRNNYIGLVLILIGFYCVSYFLLEK